MTSELELFALEAIKSGRRDTSYKNGSGHKGLRLGQLKTYRGMVSVCMGENLYDAVNTLIRKNKIIAVNIYRRIQQDGSMRGTSRIHRVSVVRDVHLDDNPMLYTVENVPPAVKKKLEQVARQHAHAVALLEKTRSKRE